MSEFKLEYKLIAPMRDNATLLEQILYNRGFTSKEQIQHFLMVDENDLVDPLRLDNMREGVEMLAKHVSLGSNAKIIVDADADGYTSSAIFLNYFNRHFPSWVQNHITYSTHEGKQHGLNDQNLSEYLNENIKLVIVPDAASNDTKEHYWLAQHGIDCLILDHHEADCGYSQWACVINNQLSDKYPTKSLCGAAVVYKFCCYFDKIMGTNYAIDYADLAALGLN